MVQQVADGIDRPAPGHYQGRLRAVLIHHPVTTVPPRREPDSAARRQRQAPPRRWRSGQLALPLEGAVSRAPR
ncbi:MAG TPA: hypothetical protein VG520_02090 [Candidatus Dormibacteraeota bacterium]|nr:hypothetical protein [Candidatus Dormibacteraeota bacterium]